MHNRKIAQPSSRRKSSVSDTKLASQPTRFTLALLAHRLVCTTQSLLPVLSELRSLLVTASAPTPILLAHISLITDALAFRASTCDESQLEAILGVAGTLFAREDLAKSCSQSVWSRFASHIITAMVNRDYQHNALDKVYAGLLNRMVRTGDQHRVISSLFDMLDMALWDVPANALFYAPSTKSQLIAVVIARHLRVRIQALNASLLLTEVRPVPLLQTLDTFLRSMASEPYRHRINDPSFWSGSWEDTNLLLSLEGLYSVRETCRQIVQILGPAEALVECGRAVVGSSVNQSDIWKMLEMVANEYAQRQPPPTVNKSDANRLRIQIGGTKTSASVSKETLKATKKTTESPMLSYEDVHNRMTSMLARIFTYHHAPLGNATAEQRNNSDPTSSRLTFHRAHFDAAVYDLAALIYMYEPLYPDLRARIDERLLTVSPTTREDINIGLRRHMQRKAAEEGLRYVGEFLLERLKKGTQKDGDDDQVVRNVEFERVDTTGDIRVLVDGDVVLTVTREELREVEAKSRRSLQPVGASDGMEDVHRMPWTPGVDDEGILGAVSPPLLADLPQGRKVKAAKAPSSRIVSRRGMKRDENPVGSDEDYENGPNSRSGSTPVPPTPNS